MCCTSTSSIWYLSLSTHCCTSATAFTRTVLNEVTRENDEAEIGYFITPKEWNKGYATEALNVIIKELFRTGFKSVLCGHFEENAASRRVMQKCGMTKAEKEETVTYRNKEHHCFYYRIRQ